MTRMISMPEPRLPKFSVIIPARNVERYIGDCLRSLLTQDFPDWEAIVVENGSTDDTARVAALFDDPRVRLIQTGAAGVSGARNAGLAIARGEVVIFLDADDFLTPTALRQLDQGFERNPHAAAVVGRYVMTDEAGIPLSDATPLPRRVAPPELQLEQLLTSNFIANGGHVAVRRSYLDRIPLFDQGIALGEDWVIWCRLAAVGEYAFLPAGAPLLMFRQRQDSAFRTLAQRYENFRPCVAAIFDDPLVRSRLTAQRLSALRRRAEADGLWTAGREILRSRTSRAGALPMLMSILRSFSARRAALCLLTAISPALAGAAAHELRPYGFSRRTLGTVGIPSHPQSAHEHGAA
jgi:glycosyltransferase involved in cell wall biosynthesis